MKLKIKKRDVLFFVLGFLTFLIIELILNWDEAVEGFKEGYGDGLSSVKIEKQEFAQNDQSYEVPSV